MILVDHKEPVAKWVSERLRNPEMEGFDGRWYEAMGFLDAHERLCGGIVYYNWVGHDIEACAAGVGQWLTRQRLECIFWYPFVQLECRRMSVQAARRNKRSRKFIEKLGFKLEGVKRKGYHDGQDCMLYGMLREDCRWIEHEARQNTEAA